MAYNINPQKVVGVVIEANEAVNGKGFNHGEVLLGLAELIGRIIAEAIESPIQASDLIKVVNDHMKKTIEIGTQAQGKRIILES